MELLHLFEVYVFGAGVVIAVVSTRLRALRTGLCALLSLLLRSVHLCGSGLESGHPKRRPS